MLLHRFREGTEDNAGFGQLFLESRGNRDAVEHRINGHARKPFLFFEWNAELSVSAQNFRIEFAQALRPGLLARLRVRVDVLTHDRAVADVGPLRLRLFLLERRPMPVSLEPP